jgi:hypothetical protein
VRRVKPNLASKGLQQEEIVLMDGGPARPAQDFVSVAVALRAGKHFYNSALGTKSHRKKEISLSLKILKRFCLDNEMDVKKFWTKIYYQGRNFHYS